MTDKIAIVTGANAGLGFQTTRKLAEKGFTVVMACRNEQKAAAAHSELVAEMPNANIVVMKLDVSNLESVREFVAAFAEKFGVLDLLINNAGITNVPMSRNAAGHEMQLATNYLGPFALTGLLLPYFRQDADTRIINVGSLAHRFSKLNFEEFNWEKGEYKEMKSYARSKIAMQTFTAELNRRLQESGSRILVAGAHPGFAATEITAHSAPKSAVGRWIQDNVMKPLIPTAEDASRPSMLAACGEGVQGGDYYGPGGFMEIAGKPGKARINPHALDIEAGKKLWTLSESMTGVSFLSDI